MARALHGILVIDKPEGMTSFAVVRAVRRVLEVARAGHTGTLDPLATGVLPICLEEATKIAGLLLAETKEYVATARLGVETDTLDREGRVIAEHDASGTSRAQVELAVAGLVGRQMQVPPSFSAVRSGGERAYRRARRGEAVLLAPREVEVHRLALTRFELPELELEVRCSKGTFVRSLVSELGRRLGCGAMLIALRRVRSGPFDLQRAVPLDAVEERERTGSLPFFSIDEALGHLPAFELASAEEEKRLRQGQPVGVAEGRSGLLRLRLGGELVALGEERAGRIWPTRVFRL